MTPLALAVLVLLAGTVLSLVLRDNRHRAWAAISSQLVASVMVVQVVLPTLASGGDYRGVVTWSYPIETIAVHLDALSAFFLAWSLPMTLLGTVYASGYLRPYFPTRNAGVQFGLLNIISLSFIMVYTLESAFVFLLGWEIAAVAAWLLVIWDYRNQKIRFAGFNYLVSTHAGLFVLVAAFMVMHSQTGSMDFQSFGTFLKAPGSLRNVTFVLLIVSFGLKSAFFPFHTWLPRAHSAALVHVSALMSGVIHKAGLFGLLRFTLLIAEPEEWMGWFVIAFSALSAIIGVLYTTTQRDVKRLLGYSSTENVGIAGIGFGIGYLGLSWHQPTLVALGFAGGILHVLNHAIFKCLLFYAAGAVYRMTHTVDLERLGGLLRKMPVTGFFFLLGGLAISALPPFNGFISEFLIYSSLLGQDAPPGTERVLFVAVAALLAFVGAVSALAITRSFGVMFLGSPRDPGIHCQGECPVSMILPMALHAVGILVLGLVPSTGLWLVEHPVRLFVALLGPDAMASMAAPTLYLLPVVGVAALVVAVVGGLVLFRWFLLGPQPRVEHVTWGCGYTAPSPRMQYTGTSFSARFAELFDAVLVQVRRSRLPEGPFPQGPGHLNTHCVDAVERRIFEVLGQGEDAINSTAQRIPNEPRYSFAAGLLVLIIIVILMTGPGALG